MNIRKILKTDLIGCAKILKNEYSVPPYNENFVDNNELNYINSKFENNADSSFVIKKDDKIIWFCFCSISYWTNWKQAVIEEIVISKDYQWLWLWKKLYNFVEKFLKELWVKSLMLWCHNDSWAYSFHQKNGFFPSDEHTIMFKEI